MGMEVLRGGRWGNVARLVAVVAAGVAIAVGPRGCGGGEASLPEVPEAPVATGPTGPAAAPGPAPAAPAVPAASPPPLRPERLRRRSGRRARSCRRDRRGSLRSRPLVQDRVPKGANG